MCDFTSVDVRVRCGVPQHRNQQQAAGAWHQGMVGSNLQLRSLRWGRCSVGCVLCVLMCYMLCVRVYKCESKFFLVGTIIMRIQLLLVSTKKFMVSH